MKLKYDFIEITNLLSDITKTYLAIDKWYLKHHTNLLFPFILKEN